MSGNSAHLDVITQNILAGPIPVNPPQYVWNIPADTPTMPSCKLNIVFQLGKRELTGVIL